TQPASSGAHYLLEETASVRPYRRNWLGMTMLMFVLVAAGFGGWTYYVKSQTGSFPPVVQKVIAAVHPETQEAPAAEPAAEVVKPSPETAATAPSPENVKPSSPADNSVAASSAPASTPEASATQKPTENEAEKTSQTTSAINTEDSNPAITPAAKPPA